MDMPRNKHFHSLRYQPHHGHHSLLLQQSHINGPALCFNPTRARFAYDDSKKHHFADGQATPVESTGDKENLGRRRAHRISFEWRSRNNRKGRSLFIVHLPRTESEAKDSLFLVPQPTASIRPVLRNIGLMFTYYPYWDISYLIGILFTLGSVVWVINSFFAWLPLDDPGTVLTNEVLTGGGVTAFIGATIFELGSVLLVLEAMNANHEGCFGWAVVEALQGIAELETGGTLLQVIRKEDERDHHYNRSSLLGTPTSVSPPSDPMKLSDQSDTISWQWLPSLHELRTHYMREIGFLASLSQLVGATIFWISGLTALPGINNKMSQGLLDGLYWTPQIVGGTGFIVSGVLFMLETQRNWYVPEPRSLGWHIGLWNLIGAFGFTLCGALGPAYNNSGAQYEASLATFWGSWSFLIGSVIQWYESLGKWVVEHVRDE
ncbi:hypothetical protein V1520DRAFT_137787 [Lipomyces starkeyi]|uniref:Integral membrane protein n=1 Tax=Lipomyces starkeyi NRRL Y-11557 TaxID=675824 RepID=A0A1E3QEB2_LIPST|nr:hypothetical protein LIPSTDRAFT_224228 [Lipomyces starkeyi NRRL Y-11557]